MCVIDVVDVCHAAENRDWIAGVVIALLIFIVLVCIIAYVLWRRRHPKPRLVAD